MSLYFQKIIDMFQKHISATLVCVEGNLRNMKVENWWEKIENRQGGSRIIWAGLPQAVGLGSK